MPAAMTSRSSSSQAMEVRYPLRRQASGVSSFQGRTSDRFSPTIRTPEGATAPEFNDERRGFGHPVMNERLAEDASNVELRRLPTIRFERDAPNRRAKVKRLAWPVNASYAAST